MPDATVNIGGNAAGAVAAVAEAQTAINSLTGKTVRVNVDVRQNGAGVAGLAGDLGRAGGAAERAGRSARNMGDNFERAGRSARDMGGHFARAGDGAAHAADQAERMHTHMSAVDNIMRGGAPGMVAHAQGMRQMATDAQSAARAIGNIGSGVQQAQRAIGSGDNGGFRTMGANAHGVSVEVMGIYRNTRQAITAAGEAGSAFSNASGHTSQMGTDLARTGARAGEAGKELARLGESGRELERASGGIRSLGSAGNGLSGADLALKGMVDTARDASRGFEDVGSTLGGMAGIAGSAAGPLRMAGLVAGVSAIGMGALGAAVAGVGLAGVAEDFMHNNQLMNAGQDAVRGFNKQFSAMKSETSAAGLPGMQALGASMKGVGHELAGIGAANMGPTLQHANELAGSLTQTMKQLAPAIAPSEQALTSLAGAALGAFGNSAPEIARFANIVTQNAAGLQSGTESVIRGASALGGGLVQGVSAAAPFLHGAANAAAWGTDAVSGAFGIPSNFSSTPGPDGSLPGSVDTGIPDGMGGTVKNAGSSPLSRFFSGAAKGAPIGAAVGLFGGPAAEVTAPIGGLVGGIGGGIAGLMGVPGFTPADANAGSGAVTPGPIQSQKSMGLGSRPGRFGNFGPGSGGPAVPAGPSAAQTLTSERADAGLPAVGQPHWDGTGARTGFGSGVRPMSPSAAVAMGGGGIAPLNAMQSAMTAQVAGGGAQTGTAMVQHIQKAVQTAAPAAAAGGASLGAGMNAGMAQGSNSSQTVIDTVTIKHMKHVIDIASAALGIHSPSTEFDYLGRMTSQGYAQGVVRETHKAGSAAVGLYGRMKSSYDDQPEPGVTVSVRRKAVDADTAPDQARTQAMQYSSPLANANIDAHNARAGQLAAGREAGQRQAIGGMTHDERMGQLLQNRADNHERALANLHISGHVNPYRDQNSARNNVNPFVGTGRDPVAAAQAKAAGRFLGMYNMAGQNSAIGLSQGMNAHVGKIQASGANLAGAGIAGYKKKDKQSSPSAVWAEAAGNSVAGAVGGFNAGAPAIAAAGAAMAAAAQAPGNDSMLQLGYTWAQNVVTGFRSALKTDLFQSGANPEIASEQAKTALGQAGLLGPGAGASVYKNQSVAFSGAGVVAQPQILHATIPISIDGNVVRTIATQIALEHNDDLIEMIRDAITGGNG